MNMFNNKWFKFTSIILIFFIAEIYFPIIIASILNIDIINMDMNTSNILILITSLMLMLIYIPIYRRDLIKDLKDFKKNFNKYFSIGFKYWLIGISTMFLSNILINYFIPNANANNENIIQEVIKISPILSLVLTAITAPFIEEITFRKSFREVIKNNTIYILVAGITFGAVHVIFSLTDLTDLFYIIPYASLGIILAIMYVKTNNIFTPILMHALHNGIFTTLSIVLYLLGGK